MEMMERVSAIGLMPVVADLVEMDDCLPLGEALCRGGIPAAEITFRMKGAEKAIRMMRDAYPDMVVGAGTVTDTDQVKKAMDAGAMFVVTPGLNPDVVSFCQKAGMPVIPGVATPSELDQAINLGLKTVKFFPAEQNGGLRAIKALCGPYKGVNFMPTGGIGFDNLAEYLSFDRISCCGGTFMLGGHVAAREWDKVVELCKKAVSIMLGTQIAHVGINCENEEKAQDAAKGIASLLALESVKDGQSSIFAGTLAECMKAPYFGAKGHVGVKTNNLERAIAYLSAMGTEFNWDSAKRDAAGKVKAIYIAGEIGGFAFHLV